MEITKEEEMPFSSDECPNSGEDSDEDVITDYLKATEMKCINIPVISNELENSNIQPNFSINNNSCLNFHDDSKSLRKLETHPVMELQDTVIPIDNVAAYSSGFFKQYTLLEEPLRHLHEIHNKIYQLRDLTINSSNSRSLSEKSQKKSISCPAMLQLVPFDKKIMSPSEFDICSESDYIINFSTNSSPTHCLFGDQDHQLLKNRDRRRSCTDLEDSRLKLKSCIQNNLQSKNIKQRSVSLSSLDDSDIDIEDENNSRKRNIIINKRLSLSQSSTHSLNEADFVKSECKKVIVKRSNTRLKENRTLMKELEGVRLPLQKSVSTPSISTPSSQIAFSELDNREPSLLITNTGYDDQNSEKTRRKRGSIFFRKKKEKNTKKVSQPHYWSSASMVTISNLNCDVCMKTISNVTALHCEACGSLLHEVCKDTYQSECTKSKVLNKGSFKSISNNTSLSNSIIKRSSISSLTPISISGTCSSQTINEERDAEFGGHKEISVFDDFDFDDGLQFNFEDFENQYPNLGLGREEPDSWSAAIGRNIALKLVQENEQEMKRQEHIYEFILTEKHHCLVLLAMQKIFVDGLRKHFNFQSSVLERMFPRLQELIDIHFQFLLKLRKRQSTDPVVDTIADILLNQFSNENSYQMKKAYGEFCSRHRDAVDIYKQYEHMDSRFKRYIRHCQNNPLLKKKGVPECILFVTQRLTKYPLLVQPLIKTGVNEEENLNLRKALSLVKEILAEVDNCVAAKERKDRKLDIYHRIDAKTYALYRGVKFKKSDILQANRNLKFEGTASLMLGRSGKTTAVTVIVLSDVLFFLAEARDHKYCFFIPENKTGIVSLQKLIVREKAGLESRSIYLISSNTDEPEMFELKVQVPKDKKLWIQEIQRAIASCPQDIDSENNITLENNMINDLRDMQSSSLSKLSSSEKLRLQNETYLQSIIDELRKKDDEQAILFEQKMQLHIKLHNAINLSKNNESDIYKDIPDNLKLLRSEGMNSTQIWKEALDAVHEAMRLANSLSCTVGGGSLSRSVSSVGEKHTDTYIPTALSIPRRAETFAGFDKNKERNSWRDADAFSNLAQLPKTERSQANLLVKKEEHNLDSYSDQREVAIRLSHYVHTLLCIISNQMTTIENLQTQIAATKETACNSKISFNRSNPNRQLEELRNLQDNLSREKSEFRISSQQERAQLDEERSDLNKWRNQLVLEQRDIEKQRDQLYRKLEALERQGVSLLPPTSYSNMPVLTYSNSSLEISQSRKKTQTEDKSSSGIPQNLFSATNQQKVQQLPVKQQLPLKLASMSNNSISR